MPSGDAELLELGRKFEAALAQSREASEKYDAICERVHLRADAKACRSKNTAAYLQAWPQSCRSVDLRWEQVDFKNRILTHP
jgi:hypothetical protein